MKRFLPFGLLALVGCGGGHHWVGEGTIAKQVYEEPSTVYIPPINIPGSCYSTGKTMSCSPGVNVPGYWMNEGPHWNLVVRSADGKDHTVEVGQSDFAVCLVGRRYNTSTGCAR